MHLRCPDRTPRQRGCDSAGLHLTTTLAHDALGRVSGMTDPRGNDWLYAYNPLDQCVQSQSPAMPNRISMNVTIDAGGRVARCESITSHRMNLGCHQPGLFGLLCL